MVSIALVTIELGFSVLVSEMIRHLRFLDVVLDERKMAEYVWNFFLKAGADKKIA